MANPDPRLRPVSEDLPRPVLGVAADWEHGERIPRHRHRRAQLVHAASGVMTVTTRSGTWVVPPQRAVWVPGGTVHEIGMSGRVAMRTLYVEPDARDGLPTACCVVGVSGLLRELILRVVAMPQPHPRGGAAERLVEVALDEIAAMPQAPLHLPMPVDPRVARVARALREAPHHAGTLGEWARVAGASPRTLARLFQRDTGMSFGAWRRQLRLLRALERLAAGEPVTGVALSLGYDSPSAFIAMFRRQLGTTPGEYFAAGALRPGPTL